jgi:hypothetical protein
MKVKSLLMLLTVSLSALTSCSTLIFGNKYNYSYGLLDNNNSVLDSNASMHFKGSLIEKKFMVGEKSINFTLQNNSGKTARIIWDETLFIKFGSTGRVMHSGVKYADRNSPQPPSIIPASTRHEDVIIPTENIYWRDGYCSSSYSRPGGWETRELFPMYDFNKPDVAEAILKAKGVEFQIFMPIQFGEEKKEYSFRFKIRNVVAAPKSTRSY